MKDAHLQDLDELTRQFFAGEVTLHPAAVEYNWQELCDLFRENVRQIVDTVRDMSPAQLAYRMPGSPTGPDASGDEEHFDTSQIVTHLAAGIAFHWWGMARALGHDRPEFPRPPEGARTTAAKGRVMGAGGWSGEDGERLSQILQDTANRFLAYIDSLPGAVNDSARSSLGPFKDMSPHDWLFLEMLHTAMHLKQIRSMRAQPDYPQ